MRVAELLAIVAICPLGIIGSGCRPIEQPIGQYSASATRPAHNNAGGANAASSGTQTGSSGSSRVMDAGAGSFDDLQPATLPDPILPTDVSSGTAPAAPGTSRPPNVQRAMCYTGSDAATRKRLDMYLVMDANVTLPYTGAWEVATTGVRNFVQDPATEGLGVGLRYFGSECVADAYASNPTVEVAELPGNEGELVAASMMQADYTASPMASALEGGIQHQMQRAKEHPDRKQIVVLISDGFTQDLSQDPDCRYSLQQVQDIAAAGFSADVQTYVIGFGAPDTMNVIADEVLARFSGLNAVARDGGSTRSYSVKFNDDPENMHDALTAIRRDAQPCAYDFPSTYDPALLNLSILPGSFVPRVDGRASCGQTAQGFFYGPDDADKPSSVELCPATCRLLQLGDFDALFYRGCATVRL